MIKDIYNTDKFLRKEIKKYIKNHLKKEKKPSFFSRFFKKFKQNHKPYSKTHFESLPLQTEKCACSEEVAFGRNFANDLEKTFADYLFEIIDSKNIKDSDCYKKANVDRKLFSKIRSNSNYIPRKTTVLAFAIALELDLEETQKLLNKAGYSLSHSFLFDVIVEYFINQKQYDIFVINEVLSDYKQQLLGSNL